MPRRPTSHRPGLGATGPEPREGYVAVGRVVGRRGVRGELKVEPLTDFPDRFAPGRTLWLAGQPQEVEASQHRGRLVLLRLAGIDSADDAARLRGELLEIPEHEAATLGEGEYYRFQIIGLAVEDADGRPLGSVVEVLATGSNDVYVVRGPQGELLIPALEDVIKEVDLEGGRLVVDLPEGLEVRPQLP